MKCALCRRPLFKPAASIGNESIGRACAKRAGLLEPKHRRAGTNPRSLHPAAGQMALGLVDRQPVLKQGSPYSHDGAKVIVVRVDPPVRVVPVLDTPPWIGLAYEVDPAALIALPSRYLQGGIPA